jgi:hypothetical protein
VTLAADADLHDAMVLFQPHPIPRQWARPARRRGAGHMAATINAELPRTADSSASRSSTSSWWRS